MILTLIFLLILEKHLTWYENFEHAEKLYHEKQYSEAVTALQSAIAEKNNPEQKAFTRAVQTIEYKPYYYLALCYRHLGDQKKAYRAANLALKGEVVPNQAMYLNDLAPIFEDHLVALARENQQYESKEEGLRQRLLFFQHLSAQEFKEAEALLSFFSEEQRSEYAAMLRRLSDLPLRREQMEHMVSRYKTTLNRLIEQGEKKSAYALLEAMSSILSSNEFNVFLNQIQLLPEPVTPTDTQQEQKIPEVDPGITILIDSLKNEKQKLESLIARDQQEIQNLSTRIEKLSENQSRKGEIELSPELNASLEILNTTLICTGQILAPNGIQSAVMTLGNETRSLLKSNHDPVRTLHFKETYANLNVGKGKILIQVTDRAGLMDEKNISFTVAEAWYRTPQFLGSLMLGALLWAGLYVLYRFSRKRKALLKHFNPYIAGVPVREKDMFFGRDKLLERIEKLVQNNCLMIFGQRRIGKTSLLHQLFDRLTLNQHPGVRFFPVFIDLQGVHETDLFHLIMGEILATYPELEKAHDLLFRDEQTNYTSRLFSKDLKKIVEGLQKDSENHIHIVLLMDEVDAINDFSEKTNQKLRGIFMKTFSDHLSSIMAGIHLKKHWESSGSPWYNFFEEIPMTHISPEAARDLITSPVKGIFKFQPEAIELIIEESGCQPFLVQKICVSLINQQLEKTARGKERFKILRKDVEQILRKMRDERKTIEGVQNS